MRLDDGSEVEATLADRPRVTAKPGAWPHGPRVQVSDLQPGMTVQFKWDSHRIASVLVLAAPEAAKPGGGYETPAAASWGGAKGLPAYDAGLELPAVVVEVNVAAGTLTAEVDGRTQAFVADPRDLRELRKGERVVLTTGEGGRLAAVRPARP